MNDLLTHASSTPSTAPSTTVSTNFSSSRQVTRILVVDDDATFRTRLVAALASRGHTACGAGGRTEALDAARRSRPQRAIVDLRMPEGSGLDVVKDLVTLDPEMRVIVLTGWGSIASAIDAVRRGAIDYLSKPADTDQILAAFDRFEREEADTQVASDVLVLESAPSLARVEWEHIQRVLNQCEGNISHAARVLGIHRRSLQRKLCKYPPGP